jgi:uncharacterized membrane protein
MKKLILIGIAIAALVATPIFAASTANAQTKKGAGSAGANSGYCKSGARANDMANCKENGGNK